MKKGGIPVIKTEKIDNLIHTYSDQGFMIKAPDGSIVTDAFDLRPQVYTETNVKAPEHEEIDEEA